MNKAAVAQSVSIISKANIKSASTALCTILLILWLIPSIAIASIGEAGNIKQQAFSSQILNPYKHEKEVSGWAVSFDNDVLVSPSRDQDYTYGTSFTIAGTATRDYYVSLHKPLSWLNKGLGIPGNSKVQSHSFEVGLYGFTPEDRTQAIPNSDDRPYASIVYISNTQKLATSSPNTIWRTTLTLGVLGLDIVGDIQNEVHRATDGQNAAGWGSQISEGGELTARYSVARQTRWNIANPNIELKSTTQASIGYISEVSWGSSLRLGSIGSSWQSYNPELTAYGEQSNQSVIKQSVKDRYFTLGAAVKYRFYNALLEGQFKNSVFEYDSEDLNQAILEVWTGYTHSFANNYRLSYLVRAHSSELKEGSGDRNVVWGSLTLSKTY